MLRATIAAAAFLLVAASSAQAQSSWPAKPVKNSRAHRAGRHRRRRRHACSRSTSARSWASSSTSRTAAAPAAPRHRIRGGVAGRRLHAAARRRTIASNHFVYKKLPYDVLRDLAPSAAGVAAERAGGASDAAVQDAGGIHRCRQGESGQDNYGSAGVGSNLHLAMELLKAKTGIDVVHVPYKGVGPAMSDLLGGHVGVDVLERGLGQASCELGQAARACGDLTEAARQGCRTCRRSRKRASRTMRC